MIIDILSSIITSILIGICLAWVFLIKSMWMSFRDTPYLDRCNKINHNHPRVSIILPARNEEAFIGNCLKTLVEQDYPNYEIIVINDSSQDSTGEIISQYSKLHRKIISISARPKPKGWMGKNWACMEGFKKATGDLLLFTDADTKHSKNMISLSVNHLIAYNLNALTVIPRLRTIDFWTKITLPMISTFLHTRFSALRVNDPKKKTGYFFGSFFIIDKKTYEKVGTHEGVKNELIEDGALGKKVKETGHALKMVRGEHLVEAIWARDKSTLWNALKRLMVPLYLQNKRIAFGIFVAVLFLLFIPFPVFIFSLFFAFENIFALPVFLSSLFASILIYAGAILEVKKGLGLKLIHAVFAPLGGLVISLAFLSGLIHAEKDESVLWRGRSYSMKDRPQDSIRI